MTNSNIATPILQSASSAAGKVVTNAGEVASTVLVGSAVAIKETLGFGGSILRSAAKTVIGTVKTATDTINLANTAAEVETRLADRKIKARGLIREGNLDLEISEAIISHQEESVKLKERAQVLGDEAMDEMKIREATFRTL